METIVPENLTRRWTVSELNGKTVRFSGLKWVMHAEEGLGIPDVVLQRFNSPESGGTAKLVTHWLDRHEVRRITRAGSNADTDFVLVLDYTL